MCVIERDRVTLRAARKSETVCEREREWERVCVSDRERDLEGRKRGRITRNAQHTQSLAVTAAIGTPYFAHTPHTCC